MENEPIKVHYWSYPFTQTVCDFFVFMKGMFLMLRLKVDFRVLSELPVDWFQRSNFTTSFYLRKENNVILSKMNRPKLNLDPFQIKETTLHAIKSERSIAFIEGSQVIISNSIVLLSLKSFMS